jgi:hypothetical protein
MSDEPQLMEGFIDFRPNLQRNEQSRRIIRQELREKFERNLPEAVERIWDVPYLALKAPFGLYLGLLTEARELFVDGHFYSCVAMCGIVGERLIKDMLRASVLIEKDGQKQRPENAAFDTLERVEVRGIVDFLNKAGLLSEDAANASRKLGEIRNNYAHASGKNPKMDAIKAIKLLHTLVEGTVSIFKDFEIKDGALIRKIATSE